MRFSRSCASWHARREGGASSSPSSKQPPVVSWPKNLNGKASFSAHSQALKRCRNVFVRRHDARVSPLVREIAVLLGHGNLDGAQVLIDFCERELADLDEAQETFWACASRSSCAGCACASRPRRATVRSRTPRGHCTGAPTRRQNRVSARR